MKGEAVSSILTGSTIANPIIVISAQASGVIAGHGGAAILANVAALCPQAN